MGEIMSMTDGDRAMELRSELDFVLFVMRDTQSSDKIRLDAAQDAVTMFQELLLLNANALIEACQMIKKNQTNSAR